MNVLKTTSGCYGWNGGDLPGGPTTRPVYTAEDGQEYYLPQDELAVALAVVLGRVVQVEPAVVSDSANYTARITVGYPDGTLTTGKEYCYDTCGEGGYRQDNGDGPWVQGDGKGSTGVCRQAPTEDSRTRLEPTRLARMVAGVRAAI